MSECDICGSVGANQTKIGYKVCSWCQHHLAERGFWIKEGERDRRYVIIFEDGSRFRVPIKVWIEALWKNGTHKMEAEKIKCELLKQSKRNPKIQVLKARGK